MTIQAVLYGTLEGKIWWPQEVCQMDVKVNLTSERERLTPNRGGSLRHMIGSVCASGDFQSAKLTEDSYIKFTMVKRNGDTLVRIVPITKFKELADYIC